MYSLTYTGVIVMLIGFIFQAAGVPFVPQDVEGAVRVIIELAGAIIALYDRFRIGGVNLLGFKFRIGEINHA